MRENAPVQQPASKKLRIGSVSFLNATPLNYGLSKNTHVDLILDVPSRLIDGMASGKFDVALLPVIDLQSNVNLAIDSAGGIACDGETLTVRLFSRDPIEMTRELAVDPDSHTSVALARIILQESFGLRPTLIDLRDADDSPNQTRLLIGDKVVCDEPAGFPFQLDLGAAWKSLTGLPFVFAVWSLQRELHWPGLHQLLLTSKRQGMAQIESLIETQAIPRGWPAMLARKYLTQYLQFDLTDRHIDAIRLFHQKAFEHGLLEGNLKPLIRCEQ